MQGIEGGVLVLLANQQGDVKVARCDEHDFNTCTGQCGQRTGGDAAAGDHLLTNENKIKKQIVQQCHEIFSNSTSNISVEYAGMGPLVRVPYPMV